MKFAISAVVMLALAMGVQSSIYAGLHGLHGLHGLGLGHGYVSAVAHPGPLLAQGPALLGGHHLGLGHLLPAAHIPAAVAVAPHAAILGAPHAAIAAPHAAIAPIPLHGGTYVAKTRGAVHTAPLPGHINSAASVNVAPAPGTY